MSNIIILALLFVCHYLADYTKLSTPYMLIAKRTGEPLLPILEHACIHGVLMGIALVPFLHISISLVFILIAIEIVTHFIIDVLKGRCNVWFPILKDNTKYPHWYVFGFDQLLHQLVIVFMYFLIVKYK